MKMNDILCIMVNFMNGIMNSKVGWVDRIGCVVKDIFC